MKAKHKLRANWGKKQNDIMLHFPNGIGSKSDAGYLATLFNTDFIDQMESRGYDITKIKFEIPIKEGARPDKFVTLHKELKDQRMTVYECYSMQAHNATLCPADDINDIVFDLMCIYADDDKAECMKFLRFYEGGVLVTVLNGEYTKAETVRP